MQDSGSNYHPCQYNQEIGARTFCVLHFLRYNGLPARKIGVRLKVSPFSLVTTVFRAFRHRDYRLLWTSLLLGGSGYWILVTAQGWLVLELTDSAFWVGMVVFCAGIPPLFLAPFGGVFADRFDQRNLLIFCRVGSVFLIMALATITIMGLVTVWHIIIISILAGIIWAVGDPTVMAIVPRVVAMEDLMNAVALSSTSWQVSRFIGPAIAGALIGAISIGGCFYFAGVSYVLALLLVLLMRSLPAHSVAQQATVLENLSEGVGYVVRNRALLMIMLLVTVACLFALPYAWMMPVFARDVLGRDVGGYSQLMMATGAGAIAGALTVASLGRFQRKGWLLIVTGLAFSVTLVLFAVSKSFFLSLVLAVLVAATAAIFFAVANTLIQTIIPDHFRGRVMGLYVIIWYLPGSLIIGAAADRVGVQLAVAAGGLVCLVSILAAALRFPALRRL